MRPQHYHFSGICGTAMASLAVLLKQRGNQVTGSDENVYPPMSDFLDENQIEIKQGYHAENLQPHPDYVVLGNTLSRGNAEVEYALKAHLYYLSMAELLKNKFIRGNRSIVITGTHGKTTTSSLTAHLLTECGCETGFMIGGIPRNFGTACKDVKRGGYFVTEGDEYDTSLFDKRSKFFHYLPDRLIINNIEFDHGDIFKNIDEIKRSFALMLRQIPTNGLIVANGDDEHVMDVLKSAFSPVLTFGFKNSCDVVISHCQPLAGKIGMQFELKLRGESHRFEIPLLGEFNVRNATAVIILVLEEKLPVHKIQAGLNSFQNVKRRLQQVTERNGVKVFDDFAHHPTAIAVTIKAIKQAWPASRIHAIYEARSNTSTRSFHQDRMTPAFREATTVCFYKLHCEERLDRSDKLNLASIVEELRAEGKDAAVVNDLDEIAELTLARLQINDIVLVMSQGDFGGLQRKIAAGLRHR